MSDEEEAEGCGCAFVILIVIGFAIWCAWEYNHPTPEQAAARQQVEQRAAEDRELAEWQRQQTLRDMRADKAKAEEPK